MRRQQFWDVSGEKRAAGVNKLQLQSKYTIETTLWGSISVEVGSTLTAVQTCEDNAGFHQGSIPGTSTMKPDFSVRWFVLLSHDHQRGSATSKATCSLMQVCFCWSCYGVDQLKHCQIGLILLRLQS